MTFGNVNTPGQFLKIVNSILKEEFNHNYDSILNEYLESQNSAQLSEIVLDEDKESFRYLVALIADPINLKILATTDSLISVQDVVDSIGHSMSTIYSTCPKTDHLVN